MRISWINPRTRQEVVFEPTVAQVESKEFWDSLSSGGFQVEPKASKCPISFKHISTIDLGHSEDEFWKPILSGNDPFFDKYR